jgi:hypothetical protein
VKVVALPIFGGVRQPPAPAAGQDGPAITVRAIAFCGGIGIRRKPPKAAVDSDESP